MEIIHHSILLKAPTELQELVLSKLQYSTHHFISISTNHQHQTAKQIEWGVSVCPNEKIQASYIKLYKECYLSNTSWRKAVLS